MTINDLIAELQSAAAGLQPNYTTEGTEAVVRCLDEEFPVDCIQIETFPGNETEPARTVVAIRIEPEDQVPPHKRPCFPKNSCDLWRNQFGECEVCGAGNPDDEGTKDDSP